MKKCLPQAVFAAVLLSACSSAPPTHYYTLVSPAPTAAAQGAGNYAIDVAPVTVPAQVDQPSLIVRQSSGQLGLIEDRQWIAALPNEIRDALSTDLAAQLGVPDVHGGSAPAGVKLWRILVDVQRFESVPGQHAQIDAVWTLRAMDGTAPVAVCSTQVSQSVGPGYTALVEGHQRALAQLATAIAAGVKQAQAGNPSNCT